MDWTIKRERRDDETGCRNADRAGGLFAGVYNGDGYGIADIDRLGRVDSAGQVTYLHEQIAGNDEPAEHATTDEQWDTMLATLAAAPAMLAELRSIRSDLGCGEGLSDAEADVLLGRIDAVLSLADPRRIA